MALITWRERRLPKTLPKPSRQAIWETPEKSSEILGKIIEKNKDVYDLDRENA